MLAKFLFTIRTVIHKCQPFKEFMRINTIPLTMGKVKKRRRSLRADEGEKVK